MDVDAPTNGVEPVIKKWLGNQADQALKSPAPNPPNSKTTVDSGFKSPVQAPFRAPGWEAKVCLIFS